MNANCLREVFRPLLSLRLAFSIIITILTVLFKPVFNSVYQS